MADLLGLGLMAEPRDFRFPCPSDVLERVAKALPADVRDKLIVCGSLAATYGFFAGDGSRAIRTKDTDGLCSPLPRPWPRSLQRAALN